MNKTYNVFSQAYKVLTGNSSSQDLSLEELSERFFEKYYETDFFARHNNPKIVSAEFEKISDFKNYHLKWAFFPDIAIVRKDPLLAFGYILFSRKTSRNIFTKYFVYIPFDNKWHVFSNTSPVFSNTSPVFFDINVEVTENEVGTSYEQDLAEKYLNKYCYFRRNNYEKGYIQSISDKELTILDENENSLKISVSNIEKEIFDVKDLKDDLSFSFLIKKI